MIATASAVLSTESERLLRYLSTRDTVHFIQVNFSTYQKHKDKIPSVRRNSLISFTNVISISQSALVRGYKLPNGSLEGKYERLNQGEYVVSEYLNGQIQGLIEHYIMSNREELYSDFILWNTIDTSRLILKWRTDENGNIVPVPGRPTDITQVTVPNQGLHVITIYHKELYMKEHRFTYMYLDGILVSVWMNYGETRGYGQIILRDHGKVLRYCTYVNGKWKSETIYMPLNHPDYAKWNEYTAYVYESDDE